MPTLKFGTAPADPTLENWLSQLYNQPQNIGYAGKQAKRTLRSIDRGDDISSLGYFNSIAQQHAANRRDIGDNYLYGGNALLAGAGGEQANILNRMRDTALARDYERQGMENTNALSDLRMQTANQFQNAYDSANQRQLQQQQGAISGRLGYYGHRYQPYTAKSGWDKFMDVGNLLVGGAQAAATGGWI